MVESTSLIDKPYSFSERVKENWQNNRSVRLLTGKSVLALSAGLALFAVINVAVMGFFVLLGTFAIIYEVYNLCRRLPIERLEEMLQNSNFSSAQFQKLLFHAINRLKTCRRINNFDIYHSIDLNDEDMSKQLYPLAREIVAFTQRISFVRNMQIINILFNKMKESLRKESDNKVGPLLGSYNRLIFHYVNENDYSKVKFIEMIYDQMMALTSPLSAEDQREAKSIIKDILTENKKHCLSPEVQSFFQKKIDALNVVF